MGAAKTILDAFYSGKSIETVKAYRNDLQTFSQYLGTSTAESAVDHLLSLPDSQANLTLLHYRTKSLESNRQASTVNRRLSTIRSLVKKAKSLGLVNWSVDIKNEKILPPSEKQIFEKEDIKMLFTACKNQQDARKASRDMAILRLLYDLVLKRSALVQMDFDDLDLKTSTILTTNGSKRKLKRLPAATKNAIEEWIRHRGIEPGPLFVNFDHARKGKRLSSTSIYRIVKEWGHKAGIRITPDQLRQTAITEALGNASKLGIDDKEVLSLTDHKSVTSLKRHKKDRQKVQSMLSTLISDFG